MHRGAASTSGKTYTLCGMASVFIPAPPLCGLLSTQIYCEFRATDKYGWFLHSSAAVIIPALVTDSLCYCGVKALVLVMPPCIV